MTSLVIDASVIAWDRGDYGLRQGEYWGLAADVVRLFGWIDEREIGVLFHPSLAAMLVERFPYDVLRASMAELRDFSRLVYLFLGRHAMADDAGIAGPVVLVPDAHSRPEYDAALAEQSSRNLLAAHAFPLEICFASHEVVWRWGVTLDVVVGGSTRRLPVIRSIRDYAGFGLPARKIYEESPKHHWLMGFGSRLPPSLSSVEMQRLLDSAVSIRDDEYFGAYDVASNNYIVFRRHHGSLFHGYPISQQDILKRGINPAIFPRV